MARSIGTTLTTLSGAKARNHTMKTIKRPKLENLDSYKCDEHCDRLEYPCSHSRGRAKAYRNNVAVNQATKLKAIDQIEETSYGVWLVCNKWYFHPNSKLARPKGQRSRYQKFKNFTTFWKFIHDKDKNPQWKINREFNLTEEDKPINHKKLLRDEDPMPIGKYRGRQLKYVPDSYLMFLWKMFGFSGIKQRRGKAGYVAEYIERRIKNKQLFTNPETQ
jgi:uncharacterized protein (DUF3820 family)